RLTNRYQESIWYYERFLSRGHPNGDALSSVQEFISEMKAELDKKATKQPPVEPAPLPSSTSSGTAESPTPPHLEVAPRSLHSAENPSNETSEAWYQDRWACAIAGGGVIGVAVGGGLLLNAQHVNSEANGTKSQQGYAHLHDQASTRNLVGLV